ncbi:MAG: hypothetical protein IJ737_06525 [Ruminococcus sp.]|nr:hypothetical protein [Ruminococcus sp.]
MLVLIDDVQFRSKEGFFEFLSRALGQGPDGIDSEEKLKNFIDTYHSEIEFVFYDFEDIPEEMKEFAGGIVNLILDCRRRNDEISVIYRTGDEGI